MGSIVKGIGKFLVGGVLGGLLGLKSKGPKPPPQPTRDAAEEQVRADDELRRRKGGLADQMVNGSKGAEAALNQIGRFNPTGS